MTGRSTGSRRRPARLPRATPLALCQIPLRNSSDCILSLDGLLGLVDGRVPLLIEVKSTWSGDHDYEQNIADALAGL